MSSLRLRRPRPDEFETLARLCFRSKAVWGYDADFMERCRPSLRVSPEQAAAGWAMVAVDDGGHLGVAQVSFERAGETNRAELDLLFVDPNAMGRGVGRRLFDWAVDAATGEGAGQLGILADPDARPFYERMGAKFVEMLPSDVIVGRLLPWLELDLNPVAPAVGRAG